MSQRNQTKRLTAGHFSVLDNSREFNICHQSNAGIAAFVVRLRRSELPNDAVGSLFDLDTNFRSHRLMPLLRMNLAELAAVGKTISDEELGFFGKTIETVVRLIASSGDEGANSLPAATIWDAMITRNRKMLCRSVLFFGSTGRHLRCIGPLCSEIFASRNLAFSDYLRERRLSRAADRLTGPRCDQGIEAIAFACGFLDLSTFNRSFKRRFGMTPGEMRRGIRRIGR
jgi:AraC-like DNA-binding protein